MKDEGARCQWAATLQPYVGQAASRGITLDLGYIVGIIGDKAESETQVGMTILVL